MRKDLRVGLGIGGVLLAVLAVAFLARSGSKPPKQQASAQNDPSGTDGSEATPLGDSAATPPAGATEAAKPPVDEVFGDPNTPQPRASKTPVGTSADWDKLFNAGGTGGAVVTDTPTPGGKTRAGGAVAGLGLNARGEEVAPGGQLLKTSLPPVGTGRAPTRATTPALPATGGRPYVIQQGDTLVSIARATYGNDRAYLQIQNANPGLNANALRVGTKITLPNVAAGTRTSGGSEAGNGRAATAAFDRTREYRVSSGDSLHRISQKLYGDGGKADALYELNKQTIGSDPARLKLGTVLRLPEPPTVVAAR